MPQIITDFMKLDEIEGRTSVALGSDASDPTLQELREGQEVELLYPENLKARGHIHIIAENGKRYFYGIIDGAIEPINN